MYISYEDIAAGEREEARILRRSLTESRHSLQECEASLQEVLHDSEHALQIQKQTARILHVSF